MKRAIAASAAMLLANLAWSVLAVSGAGPWAPDSAAVLGATLVTLTAIAIVGMLIGASRWARRLSVVMVLVGLAMAVALESGPLWVVALTLSAAALLGLAGNATLGVIRRLPAADGPTPRVVAFALCLAAIPGVVAVVSVDGLGVAEWIVIVAGAVTAGLYAKAAPFALLAVRILFPAATVIAALISGMPRGLIWVGLGAAVALAAWTKDARLAVRPLIERGRAVPMLPEMVPGEILDAAGLDQKGRPNRTSP